jgi:hypothetical protein
MDVTAMIDIEIETVIEIETGTDMMDIPTGVVLGPVPLFHAVATVPEMAIETAMMNEIAHETIVIGIIREKGRTLIPLATEIVTGTESATVTGT